MLKKYTLRERYVEGYKKKKEELFIDNCITLLEDINFSNLHKHISEAIEKNDENYNFENINSHTYLSILFSEYNDRGLYLKPTTQDDKFIIDAKEKLNYEYDLKGIRVFDRINDYQFNVYCSDDLNVVAITKYDVHGYRALMIRDKSKILGDEFGDFDYELWILSAIGDALYEFTEDSGSNKPKFIDIIELMQKEIDKIVEEQYKSDECKPKFSLSVMDYGENAKMVLSVEHQGLKFSEVIFPHKSICYNNGFNIYSEIKDLYNRTM